MSGALCVIASIPAPPPPLVNNFAWVGPTTYNLAGSAFSGGAITLFDIVDGNADCIGGNTTGGTPPINNNIYLTDIGGTGGSASVVPASDNIHATIRVTGLNAVNDLVFFTLHIDSSDSGSPQQEADYSVDMYVRRIS